MSTPRSLLGLRCSHLAIRTHQPIAHGEQCGLGAAFATFLRGDREMAMLMVEVLRRHGLPVLPADIGFEEDEFVKVVEYAPETRPGRYTILEHLDLSADQIRDAYRDYAEAISS